MNELGNGRDQDVSLGALLQAALADPPPADLPERVMAMVAMVATGAELARLVTCVPVEAVMSHLGDDTGPTQETVTSGSEPAQAGPAGKPPHGATQNERGTTEE